jgi:hypothetical protein
MIDSWAKEIFTEYPFLSLIVYGGREFVGIIQNYDDTVLSIYDYGRLSSPETKELFLSLGDNWWWESNRQIPINLFLKSDWTPFSKVLINLNSKDCEIKFGPSVSIQDLSKKRSKRRNIQLVKRVK